MNSAHRTIVQALQSEILEAVATGVDFSEVADLLCRRAETLTQGAVCSILVVDAGGRLRPVGGPSLPRRYSDALDGLAIGPKVGSCGTAAYRGEPVEVTDISTDALWEDYAALVDPLGLMACWSSPIKAPDGRVLATFAFYYLARRGPSELERRIVETCVHLCAIALEHAEAERRNHRLAYFDPLTSLPNRRCFDETTTGLLADEHAALGLLLIDIDHLKAINDTMGHVVGDALICQVADRLSAVDPSALCYRLSGDEFAVVATGCADHADLGFLAARILDAMNAPFPCNGNMILPQVTIGGVVCGPDGRDKETLRQNADFALHHAKETNRGGYARFEAGLRTAITRRIATIREVDEALSEARILPYYQPLVDLGTGEIVGLEALARMRTGDGRIVAAGAFAAALSDPKVAWRLTGKMLSAITSDIRAWLDAGIPFQHVGINLSTADFQRGDLECRLSEAFESAGVPLKHLLLEVTETVFMDGPDNEVAKAVERLRRHGMLVALDDFGTGFASLTHLLGFPVDIIKIDKCFIDRLLTDRPSRVIVEALIDIARKLDIKIVAEGIESADQAERLADLGCRVGQGYHFARPADAATTTALLGAFARTSGMAERALGTPRRRWAAHR